MKRLALVLGLLAGLLGGCGGGGGGDDGPTEFTAAMLNTSPTYYSSYTGESPYFAEGTIQETIAFTGAGPYVVTVNTDYFDASETLVASDSLIAVVTLNQDGTLTATDPDGTAILTLTDATASYLKVTFDDGTDTWSRYWYKSQPADWLGVTPEVKFTAAMLNANPTYYTTYTEAAETVYESIAVSGSGPYLATVTDAYFDAGNTFVRSFTVHVDLTLEPDGTLIGTFEDDPAAITTLTLKAMTADYLDVSGVDSDGTTWDERWFLSQPAGWLPPTYAISFQMLRHQVSSSQNTYRGYIALTKGGDDIAAADFSSVDIVNSSAEGVTPASPPYIFTASYVAGNCTATPCTWAPSSESGLMVSFATVPPDYYGFALTMADNSQIVTIIPFYDDFTLPIVDSATMTASWAGGDLHLSWTNPTNEPDWDRVTRLKIAINSSATGNGTELAYIDVASSANSVVIPAAMIADMNGTVAGWQVQARTYTGNPANSQIARSYSDFKALP